MLHPLPHMRLALVALVALALVVGCCLDLGPGAAGLVPHTIGHDGRVAAVRPLPLCAAAPSANGHTRSVRVLTSSPQTPGSYAWGAVASATGLVSSGAGTPDRPFSLRLRI